MVLPLVASFFVSITGGSYESLNEANKNGTFFASTDGNSVALKFVPATWLVCTAAKDKEGTSYM